MTLDETLERGLAALGVPADARLRTLLIRYLHLLEKWNQVYNLTAVRGIDAMLTQHVLDSIAVVPHLCGRTLLDVGSGAGLPGLPIAIVRPQTAVTLLDSNHKKATFLRQAVIELELPNVSVVCDRVEAWRPPTAFDVVISRAFAELASFVKVAGPLCADTGCLIAMKGVYPHEELTTVPAGYRVLDVRPVPVPGLEADRHLVILQPEPVAATIK